MLQIEGQRLILTGSKGTISLDKDDDEIVRRLSMLFEGECEGLGISKTSAKYGVTRQRYYQLLGKLRAEGAIALKYQKKGPQINYKRTDEVVRQSIRHRFLDPKASPGVIAQKLIQSGFSVSIRSVERVISEYGLQKKTLHVQSGKRAEKNRNTKD